MANIDLNVEIKGGKAVSAELTNIQKVTEKTQGAFKGLTNSVSDLLSSFNPLIVAAGAFAAAFSVSKVVDAAVEQENAINRLNSALRLAGDFSLKASEDFQAFASEIQNTSSFSDDAALGLVSLAKSLGISNEQTKIAVQAAVNLQEATGLAAEVGIKKLAATLLGAAGSAKKFAPEIANLTQEQLKAGAAIEIIDKKFAGFAQATLQTFSGATNQAKGAFGDLLEELGFLIIKNPALIAAFNEAKNVIVLLSSAVAANREGIISFTTDGVIFLIKQLSSLVRGTQLFTTAFKAVEVVLQLAASSLSSITGSFFSFVAGLIRGSADIKDALTSALNFVTRSFGVFAQVAVSSLRDVVAGFGKLAALSGDNAITTNLTAATKGLDRLVVSTEKAVGAFKQISNSSDGIRKVATSYDGLAAASNKFSNAQVVAAVEAASSIKNINKQIDQYANKLSVGLVGSIQAVQSAQKKQTDDAKKGLGNAAKGAEEFGDSLAEAAKKGNESSIRITRFLNEIRVELFSIGAAAAADPFKGILIGVTRLEDKIKGLVDSNEFKDLTSSKQVEIKLKLEAELDAAKLANFVGIGAGFAASISNGAAGASKILVEGAAFAIDSFAPGVGQAVKPLLDVFLKGKDAVKAMVTDFVKALPSLLVALVQGAIAFVETLITQLPSLITNLLQAIPTIIKSVVDAVPSIINSIIVAIPLIIKSVVESIPLIINSIIDAIPSIINSVIVAIPFIINTIVSALPDILNTIISGIPSIIDRIIIAIPTIVRSVIEGIPSIIKAVIEAIPNIIGTLITLLPQIIFELIKIAPTLVIEILKGLGQGIIDAIKSAFSGIGDGVGNFVTGKESSTGIPIIGPIIDLVGSAISGIGDFLGFATGGLVPQGFTGDTFPAKLTSGEFVIDNSLTPKLEQFLANPGQGQGQTNQILTQLLEAMNRPQMVDASVQFNQNTLADIILTLNRTNRRLS